MYKLYREYIFILFVFSLFMDVWTNEEKRILEKLKDPKSIKNFLDGIPYDAIGETNRSPRFVLKEKRANCFEGALLAAAAFEYHGGKPLVVDMIAVNDDDHVIAVYKMFNRWGSISKSNTTTMGSREPVYKSIRELVMSYFDVYLNVLGEKTLRKYTSAVNLNIFNKYNWRASEDELDSTVGEGLTVLKHYDILNDEMRNNLDLAHPLLLSAVLLGADSDGLYKPDKLK